MAGDKLQKASKSQEIIDNTSNTFDDSEMVLPRNIDGFHKVKVDLRTEIVEGLRRLAFESAAESLVMRDEDGVNTFSIARLDPYHITELKQVKGGGVEIKFYDRVHAMERLYDLLEGQDSEIYSALQNAAGVWASGETDEG